MSMLKKRTVDDPYLVFQSKDGWEWRVLQGYRGGEEKPFARWFCATKSPFTFGRWEYGDAYCADVRKSGIDITEEIRIARKLGDIPLTKAGKQI